MIFSAAPKCFDGVTTLNDTDLICYCIEVDKQTIHLSPCSGYIPLAQKGVKIGWGE